MPTGVYEHKASGNLNPNWKGGKLKKTCLFCKKEFLYHKRNGGKDAKYCSTECTGKDKIGVALPLEQRRKIGESHRGEKHWRWTGGCKNHFGGIARAVFYERNTNVVCSVCGSTTDIQIHHVDVNYRNNEIDNLQALCRICHIKIHTKVRREKRIICRA